MKHHRLPPTAAILCASLVCLGASTRAAAKPADLSDAAVPPIIKAMHELRSKIVDLSKQWPDVARNQRTIGDCHAFTAAALVEAAYYRAHKPERIRINEDAVYLSMIDDTGKFGAFFPYCTYGECEVQDGGLVHRTALHILTKGAALVSGQAGRLTALHREFATYAEYYSAAVTKVLKAVNVGIDKRNEKNVENGSAPMDPYETAKVRERACQSQRCGPQLDRMRELAKAESGDQNLDSLRQQLRPKIQDFKVYEDNLSREYSGFNPADVKRCAQTKYGQRLRDDLINELDAQHPVGIGFVITGLKTWGDLKGGHAVVIKGYQPVGDSIVFLTRNSWGDHELNKHVAPPLTSDDLCRIIEMVVVLAPGEQPKAKGFEPLTKDL